MTLPRFISVFCICLFCIFSSPAPAALSESELARLVVPPLELGTKDEALPIWRVLNSGGALVGYIFESENLAPLPGFSGTPMNLLIAIDTAGTFVDVTVLDQNEPVFVSGLGPRPFHEFVRQYRGKSIASNIKVLPASAKKSVDGQTKSGTYVDGVTKATASVRIANETILASALKVAREKLANIAPKAAGRPRTDLHEPHTWHSLINDNLVKHLRIRNRDVQEVFADTLFDDDDEEAQSAPNDLYLDLWIADLGVPSIAENIIETTSLRRLQGQLSPSEEPILVLANGRHHLVKDDFVRNSTPDYMAISQQGFPVSLRDADAEIIFKQALPEFDQVMVLRVDRRLGFDPASPWDFEITARRSHGFFQPSTGTHTFSLHHDLPKSYFTLPEEPRDEAPLWLTSWKDQATNLGLISCYLVLLSIMLFYHHAYLGHANRLKNLRMIFLAVTLIYLGWIAQGQLSIVTVLGVVRAIIDTHNFAFLLYDPISLILWGYVFVSFFVWGRGTFCGWLCPFGALQEFSFLLGQKLGLPTLSLAPTTQQRLGRIKYGIALGLCAVALFSPALSDQLVEIEPFKTSITLGFDRAWPYVLYALCCLLGSAFIFKGFCRFLCPLGAVMVLGGKVRQWNWLTRRPQCANPCRLCAVTCQYNALSIKDGRIAYDDCFQCLECVDILYDQTRCVPLILNNKRNKVLSSCPPH